MASTSCRMALACLLTAAVTVSTAQANDNTLTVVRDAQTGKLRAPTAAEAAALQGKPTRLPDSPGRTLQKFHATGARGVRLNNDFMNHTVVVRQADGSLAEQCFDSQAEADAAVKAGARTASAPQAQPDKE